MLFCKLRRPDVCLLRMHRLTDTYCVTAQSEIIFYLRFFKKYRINIFTFNEVLTLYALTFLYDKAVTFS